MEVILKVVIYYYAVVGSRALYVDSLIYLLIPLVHVFRNFQLRYRVGYLASMYVGFIKEVYMPIARLSYDNEEVFMSDFEKLKMQYFDALDKLDLELSNYMRRYIFNQYTDEPSTFNDKDIAEAQKDYKM